MKKLKDMIYIFIWVMGCLLTSNVVYAKTPIQVTFCEEVEVLNTFNENFKGGIAYNGEYYLYITGFQGKVYRSLDQIAWSQIGDVGSQVIELIWDGNQFVAAIYDGIATSKDGIEWVHVSIPKMDEGYSFRPHDLVYTGQMYVLSGDKAPVDINGFYFSDGAYYYSYNLKTFQRAEEKELLKTIGGHTRPTEKLIWNGETILGLGNGIAQSMDGRVWDGSIASQTEIFGWGQPGTIWDGKQYVDPNGRISTDGIKWSQPIQKIYGDIVGFNGKEYIIVGKGLNYYYSRDAKVWEEHKINFKPTIITSIYGTNTGFVLGGNNIIHLQTTPPFENTQDIRFNDIIQMYMNQEQVGKQGVFKLNKTTYIPLRILIDNGIISYETKDKQHILTDLKSKKEHKFLEKDLFRVNSRLYIGAKTYAETFNYDIRQTPTTIYFTTIQNLKFSKLEKGNTYLASGNITYIPTVPVERVSITPELDIRGKLENFEMEIDMKPTDIRLIYGDIGTEFIPGGPVFKGFKWWNSLKRSIECELDNLPEKEQAKGNMVEEYLKLMYIKDNEIINPYPNSRSGKHIISWEESVNEKIEQADKWLIFFHKSNTVLLIDPPKLDEIEI